MNTMFQKALDDVKNAASKAWLIHFVEGDFHDLELRKLPALVNTVNVRETLYIHRIMYSF